MRRHRERPTFLIAYALLAIAAGGGAHGATAVERFERASSRLGAPVRGGFNDPTAIVYDSRRYRDYRYVKREGAILCGEGGAGEVVHGGRVLPIVVPLENAPIGARFRGEDLLRFVEGRLDRTKRPLFRTTNRAMLRVLERELWPRDVARAISLLGQTRLPEAFPLLAQLLDDEDGTVRAAAASAIGRYGDAALPAATALIGLLSDDVADDGAQHALSRIGPAAIPLLARALDTEDTRVRSAVVKTLVGFGPAARGAVPALLKAEEYAAIADIGPDAADAVPALAEVLRKTENHDHREGAATALAALGPVGRAALRDVAATHAEPTVRYDAIDRLTRDKTTADGREEFPPDAIDVLVAAAGKEADSNIVALVARRLRSLEPRSTVPLLAAMLERDAAPAAAARALGLIGPAAKDAVPALIAAMSADSAAEWDAVEALGRIGTGAAPAIPALQKKLAAADDPRTAERVRAAIAAINAR